MLDEFKSSAETSAGFPDHPNMDFETVTYMLPTREASVQFFQTFSAPNCDFSSSMSPLQQFTLKLLVRNTFHRKDDTSLETYSAASHTSIRAAV